MMRTYSDIFRTLKSRNPGSRLRVPANLGHPANAGFTRQVFAERDGQVEDWTQSFDDGSRLHVHVKANGAMVAHRDRFDPGHSPVHAALHLMLETRTVPALVSVGAIVFLAVAGVSALSKAQ